MGDGGGMFSIFVFLFSFLPLVSVPQGRKREKGRRKKGKRLLAWSVEAENFLFSFFYFRSWPWFPSPCGVRRAGKKRRKKNEE
jgi:hypothetical protein